MGKRLEINPAAEPGPQVQAKGHQNKSGRPWSLPDPCSNREKRTRGEEGWN